MSAIHYKRVARRDIVPNAGKIKGSGPGAVYTRRSVSADTIDFVKECFFSRYKKARPWHFLKPEERVSRASIADALVSRGIVTCTTRQVVKAALVELYFQGLVDLPPPTAKRPSRK